MSGDDDELPPEVAAAFHERDSEIERQLRIIASPHGSDREQFLQPEVTDPWEGDEPPNPYGPDRGQERRAWDRGYDYGRAERETSSPPRAPHCTWSAAGGEPPSRTTPGCAHGFRSSSACWAAAWG